MSLIVQKFGGTSVADVECLRNVAKIVTNAKKNGNKVVVVVSAQGETTDDLEKKAFEINEKPSKREMDVLLSSGEQISVSLLAMAIERLGFSVISLTGWQAGFKTEPNHCNARIKKIDTSRLEHEMDLNKIVIVAGFQGIDQFGDITTLGRGGSDTSAVALAAALNADLCQIYTDVDGIYTADPNLVKNAIKLDSISFDEMLELTTLGAQVLHSRSVEMAKRYNVNLEVLSSFENIPGTKIKEKISMEKLLVRGITKDDDTSRIALLNVPNRPGFAYQIFSLMGKYDVNVDVILQSIGRGEAKDVSFTVPTSQMKLAVEVLEKNTDAIGTDKIQVTDSISKVSIVGAGMHTNPGVAAKMFEALYDAEINIQMISTSDIKISVLIDQKYSDRALNALHEAFFE